ncbi:GCN5-related N-acetyltransferase [Chondrocystis sp. NIES-4102]|nr:GCN5-related N-acetyltransferase [Chondrocystis sp. NIES-4102]
MINSLEIKIVPYQSEITAIRNIRSIVFLQEQKIAPELEFDGLDATAIHLLGYLNSQPVATARIRELDSKTAKIERLAVLPEARKQGMGEKLMQVAIETITQQQKSTAIVHAQAYIARLYHRLGFEIVGEEFKEAGITHVKMVKQL